MTFGPARRAAIRADLTGLAIRNRATIQFLRITRKPLPALVSPEHASPGNPGAGYFTAYVNGVRAAFPPPSPQAPDGLVLPPAGGSVAINFCKTIDLTDADRLQVIFANGLGGAVWSQFSKAESFGSNPSRTMTTGRTIVVPGLPGPPNPRTGSPRPVKPTTAILREFELLYRIIYTPRPDTATETPSSSRRGGRPGRAGAASGAGVVAADPAPAPAPSQPCREI